MGAGTNPTHGEPITVDKTILFRPQRAFLLDAMTEVVEISTRDELIVHINSLYQHDIGATEENTTIEKYIYDYRIYWDTYVVAIDGCAVGYTSGPL